MHKQGFRVMVLSMLMSIAIMMPFTASMHQGISLQQCQAFASDDIDQKILSIEERMHLLKMVMKRLKTAYIKAKKDKQFMLENGMPKDDVDRLERAFQKKVSKMIDAAIQDINNI